MTQEKKIELIAEVLDLDASELSPETDLGGLEAWDSLAALSMIVMVDEQFGKKLSGETMKTFRTVQDILDFLA